MQKREINHLRRETFSCFLVSSHSHPKVTKHRTTTTTIKSLPLNRPITWPLGVDGTVWATPEALSLPRSSWLAQVNGQMWGLTEEGVKHTEESSTSSLNCPSSQQEPLFLEALRQTALTLAAGVEPRGPSTWLCPHAPSQTLGGSRHSSVVLAWPLYDFSFLIVFVGVEFIQGKSFEMYCLEDYYFQKMGQPTVKSSAAWSSVINPGLMWSPPLLSTLVTPKFFHLL